MTGSCKQQFHSCVINHFISLIVWHNCVFFFFFFFFLRCLKCSRNVLWYWFQVNFDGDRSSIRQDVVLWSHNHHLQRPTSPPLNKNFRLSSTVTSARSSGVPVASLGQTISSFSSSFSSSSSSIRASPIELNSKKQISVNYDQLASKIIVTANQSAQNKTCVGYQFKSRLICPFYFTHQKHINCFEWNLWTRSPLLRKI